MQQQEIIISCKRVNARSVKKTTRGPKVAPARPKCKGLSLRRERTSLKVSITPKIAILLIAIRESPWVSINRPNQGHRCSTSCRNRCQLSCSAKVLHQWETLASLTQRQQLSFCPLHTETTQSRPNQPMVAALLKMCHSQCSSSTFNNAASTSTSCVTGLTRGTLTLHQHTRSKHWVKVVKIITQKESSMHPQPSPRKLSRCTTRHQEALTRI